MTPVVAMLLPLIGMAHLYGGNAEYLSSIQMLIVTLGMMAASLVAYGALYLIFRRHASALAFASVLWVMFFLFSGVGYGLFARLTASYLRIALLYALAAVLVSLLAALLARRYKGTALPAVSLTMALTLTALTLYPALRAGISLEANKIDKAAFKTAFSVDASLPSPNVYWIHADGMLGFDAVERYFGDDQKEFSDALTARGFMINRSANFESGHTTALAAPSLLNPDFYDRRIAPNVRTHEDAMALRADKAFTYKESLIARVDNELRLAFEQKGYVSETMADFSIYFPPVSDRFYMIGDSRGAYKMSLQNAEESFASIVQLTEMTILLTKMPSGMFFNGLSRLSDIGAIDVGIVREALEYPLASEALAQNMLGKNPRTESAALFSALNDSLTARSAPTLTLLTFNEAHYPFRYMADGSAVDGDALAISNYLGNHQYAAKLLENLTDMILARDPDAVIVIQGDHGLHGQSEAQILQAFGEGAVLPIWNDVISAVRVPEQYKTGDERRMMDTPLNISRYLMNRFVGEAYAYLSPEGA
jgi:hypothetical protein